VVVTENRNPIRTLAWILVLIFLPAIGIICYYIFGQVDWKAKQLFHIYNQRNKEISLQISFAKNQKKLRAKY
jgi:cardiolipin synthase